MFDAYLAGDDVYEKDGGEDSVGEGDTSASQVVDEHVIHWSPSAENLSYLGSTITSPIIVKPNVTHHVSFTV